MLRIALLLWMLCFTFIGEVESAQAEGPRAGDYELGAAASGLRFGGDHDWDSGHLLGKLTVGHYFRDELSAELGLAAGKADAPDSSDDPHLIIPTAELQFHLGGHSILPYFAAGLGVLQPIGGESNSTELIVPLGGGVAVPLFQKIRGRIDARWLPGTDFEEFHSAASITGGISYLFGGAMADSKEQAPADAPLHRSVKAIEPSPRGENIDWGRAPEREAPGFVGEVVSRRKPRLFITFLPNSSKVPASQMNQISEFADYLRSFPKAHAIIEGNADAGENAREPAALSNLRAAVVRRLVIEAAKLEPSRVHSRGNGLRRLIGKRNSEKGRMLNRRVVGRIEFAPPTARTLSASKSSQKKQ